MASSSSSVAAASHQSSSDDSDDDDTMDRLVWFRRPDTEQWWPAYGYPSHAAALEAYGHDQFQTMEPHAQRKRLMVTYLSEVFDQRERPAVRLMGVEPVALWGIGVDEQGRDLDAADATPSRLQRDFVRNLAHRLDGHVARPGTDLWNAMKEVRNLLAGEGGGSKQKESSVKVVAAGSTTASTSANKNSSRSENAEASGGGQQQQKACSKENKEEMNGSAPLATRDEENDYGDESEDIVMEDDQASSTENKEEVHGSVPTATREDNDESEDFMMNNNDHGDDDEAAKEDTERLDPKSKSTGLATTQDDVEEDDDDWEDDDEEEEVPLNILTNDSWETVLEKFRNAGWAERAGLYPDNPLQVVYYKVGTGGTGEGCREGVDYFTLEQFQGFIEREHGWDGGRPKRPRVTLSVHRGAAGRNHHKTPLAQRTKPQDPGLPLEESEVESG